MTENISPDTIDKITGLNAEQDTYSIRHQREKVVVATQGSEHALFDRCLPGLSLTERLLVAYLACQLTPSRITAQYYLDKLKNEQADPLMLEQLAQGKWDQIKEPRLDAIFKFTHTLITDPIRADQKALLALKHAGLSTPEVVTLAQLISFVSYQVRLAAGLKAMQSLETQA